jgi:hypothetical protein
VIADNKLALNAGWDEELLALELSELQELDYDLELTGFSDEEIDALLSSDFDEPRDNKYTSKIDAPLYQPTGECPPVSALCDLTKYNELVAQIYACDNLAPEVREFLLYAATRHIRFDFEKIAEFYAHADADVQRLMEESALIIIDFDKAIAGGYVKLTEAIAKIYAKEIEGKT